MVLLEEDRVPPSLWGIRLPWTKLHGSGPSTNMFGTYGPKALTLVSCRFCPLEGKNSIEIKQGPVHSYTALGNDRGDGFLRSWRFTV